MNDRRGFLAVLVGAFPMGWLLSYDGRTLQEWQDEQVCESDYNPRGEMPGWHCVVYDKDGLPVHAFTATAVDGHISYEWEVDRHITIHSLRAYYPPLAFEQEIVLNMNQDYAEPGCTISLHIAVKR